MAEREVVQTSPSTFLVPVKVLVGFFRAASLYRGVMSFSTGVHVVFSSSFIRNGQSIAASFRSRRAAVPVREAASAASSSSRRFSGISTRFRPVLSANLEPVQD